MFAGLYQHIDESTYRNAAEAQQLLDKYAAKQPEEVETAPGQGPDKHAPEHTTHSEASDSDEQSQHSTDAGTQTKDLTEQQQQQHAAVDAAIAEQAAYLAQLQDQSRLAREQQQHTPRQQREGDVLQQAQGQSPTEVLPQVVDGNQALQDAEEHGLTHQAHQLPPAAHGIASDGVGVPGAALKQAGLLYTSHHQGSQQQAVQAAQHLQTSQDDETASVSNADTISSVSNQTQEQGVASQQEQLAGKDGAQYLARLQQQAELMRQQQTTLAAGTNASADTGGANKTASDRPEQVSCLCVAPASCVTQHHVKSKQC